MSITEDLADRLAKDTIDAMDRLGDDRLFEEVARTIGATSPTTEEAFRTAMRVRIAERRARSFLEEKLAGAGKGG
ncbi:hypothetical protein [Histidinibacterium aquaticum]|uniref:Uncharacterized protein n=1 Tax=Histidinibacterium aquaticum TaxID=2613962 RepID=A0A5J5GMA8_9RHOB|nr:hypothetical protein [Histidinibacterium aquaticum]KAA9009300.1 hypothetical protein F3S47_08625 [Histidinibacterium aquaticum]